MKNKKKGKIFLIIGVVLVAAAVLLTAYNFWDNYRAGKAADAVLQQILSLIEGDVIPEEGRIHHGEMEYPDYVLNPRMDMPVKIIDGNAYIGYISIPSIECNLPVFDEWNYDNLRIAPGRYSGSVYLNNMVLCAHNYDIHFGHLRDLHYGDSVIFTDMDGNVFRFIVAEIETLEPSSVEAMTESEWDLSLFTCTLSGAARVTIRCVRE